MKAPGLSPYSFDHHANGSFTPSNTPGLKNSYNTTPNFVTPQANKALPLPGVAEHSPPKVDETVGSLVYFKLRNEPGREGMGAESEGFEVVFAS